MCATILLLYAVSTAHAQSGAYTLNGGSANLSNQTFPSTTADQSSIFVTNSGNLTLTNPAITKTGDSSNTDNSSQYGLNAAVLANASGVVTITGGTVNATASGANGLFATGSASSISMTSGTIVTTGSLAHGVDVTYGGTIHLSQVDVTTNGSSSSALATDFGGGTVVVTGGTVRATATSANSHSAGIYSTGSISVTDAVVSSVGDCGGVIDGANSILLTRTTLTGAVEGIKVWRTAPSTGAATVTIDGGALVSTGGDGLYASGTQANFTLKGGATVSAATGNIVNALASSAVTFVANAVTLSGALTADSTSAITAALNNGSTLRGAVTRTGLTVDATSTWEPGVSSSATSLVNSGTVRFTSSGLSLAVGGAYTQSADAKLVILLGGADDYDRLAVTGAAALDGTLEVNLAKGYVPTAGTSFTILTRGSGSGAFASHVSVSGLAYTVTYGVTSVQITVTGTSSTQRPAPAFLRICGGATRATNMQLPSEQPVTFAQVLWTDSPALYEKLASCAESRPTAR